MIFRDISRLNLIDHLFRWNRRIKYSSLKATHNIQGQVLFFILRNAFRVLTRKSVQQLSNTSLAKYIFLAAIQLKLKDLEIFCRKQEF